MAGRKRRKNRFQFLTKKFPVRMQRKLVLLFIAVILAFLVLVGRITYINVTKGSKYTKLVLNQKIYDSKTIPYKRGDILDRNGTKIATSERVYNVILDVAVMTDKEEYIDPTIKVLNKCFGISEKTVREIVEEKPNSRYVILKKGIDYETAQKYNEIKNDTENYPNVKGIWLEDDYNRTYPYNTLASDVIGFTYSGNIGAIGIESAYNDVMTGTDGREYGYLDEDDTVEQNVKAAKNGNNVVTTIDITLQSIVEKYIQQFNEEHAGEEGSGVTGSKNTAVMIMNPNTGEILAEASYPNFDLNKPRDLSSIYSEEKWNAIDEKDRLNLLSSIWRNFCVSDAFEPGSTMKPFTVAAGLETGTLTGDESYYCGGYLHVGDNDIGCHLRSGHGTESTMDAIANSCNVALMEMAEKIGIDNFIRYQHIFGFGEYTGIDLPAEASTASLLYTADTMTPVDLATNAFGQNFNTTMIQLGTAFCSLVNGGKLYQPRVVSKITDQNGNTIQDISPTLLRETVSKTTSDTLKQYMYSTVTSGTGNTAKVDGYSMGGKTGTAQKVPRDGVNYLVSFIGFAPVDDPQLMIYCFVDEPNSQDQPHSTFAQNIVREILEEVLPYMNIYPDEETTGLHSGWDITGTDTGAAAVTDRVTGNIPEEEPEGTDDVPDTMEDIPGAGENNEENAENDGVNAEEAGTTSDNSE